MLMRIQKNWVIYTLLTGRKVKWNHHCGGKDWQFLTKLNMHLSFDPAIQVGVYPRKMKSNVHTKICT